jgi:hypothetical protein
VRSFKVLCDRTCAFVKLVEVRFATDAAAPLCFQLCSDACSILVIRFCSCCCIFYTLGLIRNLMSYGFVIVTLFLAGSGYQVTAYLSHSHSVAGYIRRQIMVGRHCLIRLFHFLRLLTAMLCPFNLLTSEALIHGKECESHDLCAWFTKHHERSSSRS